MPNLSCCITRWAPAKFLCGSSRSYVLPARETIEPLVRELLSLLTARAQPVRGRDCGGAEASH